jgi:hypothetical protein
MEVLMGKSSINGPFSMAMLNNQRVYPRCSMVLEYFYLQNWLIKMG